MAKGNYFHVASAFQEASIRDFVIYIGAFAILGHSLYRLIYKYIEYREDTAFGRRHGCQYPPELSKRWPLGIDRIKDLWDFNAEGRLLSYMCVVAKEYEPHHNIMQNLLVGPRAFHILHPKNVESVLSTNFKHYGFAERAEVLAPLLGNGIFTQEGLAWKHSRELLRKQFAGMQYQKLDVFRDHVDNLIMRLPVNGVVDLQPLFFDLTLDTATALLFGKSVYSLSANTDQDAENKVFSESFNLAQEGLAKRSRIAPWHSFYNPPAFRNACSNVHRYVDKYIDGLHLSDELVTVGSSYDFITQVANGSASRKDLRDQLINVLLAGRDSTACCLSWAFRLLVRHEAVMNRLREEVSSVMAESEHPTREHIRKMPYLACIIKETLRLYPPVPLNIRQARRTTMLPTGGGPDGNSPILVRKGESVIFSQYVSSRKRYIYGPDADDFRPERWEGRELANIGWAYVPFNGGPRQCLGEDFALMEVSYTIIRLLQAASSITLAPGEKLEPVGSEKQRLTLVLSSADGCKVRIICR